MVTTCRFAHDQDGSITVGTRFCISLGIGRGGGL